jgi:putative redox protein
MIKAVGTRGSFKTDFTNGRISSFSDTTPDKGGSGEGFRPHELLEAALANCMNMALRMVAENHSIPLSSVETTVALDRSIPDEVCFEYSVALTGDLTESDKQKLMQSLKSCPVRETLSKSIIFREKL